MCYYIEQKKSVLKGNRSIGLMTLFRNLAFNEEISAHLPFLCFCCVSGSDPVLHQRMASPFN